MRLPPALPSRRISSIFQSTHSQRVRPELKALLTCILVFQSTHSQRVRLDVAIKDGATTTISIHALTKSATFSLNGISITIKISIHALTKSATTSAPRYQIYFAISIHSLTKSATYLHCDVLCMHLYFNPRTHKECDLILALIDL